MRTNRIHQTPSWLLVLVNLAGVCCTSGCSQRNATLPLPLLPGEVGPADKGVADKTVQMAPILLSEVRSSRAQRVLFQMANPRQHPMSVEVVDKSCGCQNIRIPEEPIDPGQVWQIEMAVTPPAKAEKKAYRATLRLVSNGQQELVRLGAELEVLSDLVIRPTELAYDFASEPACEQHLIVKQRVRSEEEPTPVRPDFADLPEEVDLDALDHVKTSQLLREQSRELKDDTREPEAERGAIWEIEWRATARLKVTERVRDGFSGQFMVICGNAEWSPVQVPVRLRCVGVIQASPPYTYFGRKKAGEERTRMILLHALDGQQFEVKDAACELPAYQARITSEGVKKLHTVQVVFRGTQSGQHTSSIRVATSHPQCPELRFGVEGSVE